MLLHLSGVDLKLFVVMRLLSSFGNAALVSPAYAVNRYFQIGSSYRHMLVVGFCIDALSLLVPLPLLLQLLSFQGSLLRYHFKTQR